MKASQLSNAKENEHPGMEQRSVHPLWFTVWRKKGLFHLEDACCAPHTTAAMASLEKPSPGLLTPSFQLSASGVQ